MTQALPEPAQSCRIPLAGRPCSPRSPRRWHPRAPRPVGHCRAVRVPSDDSRGARGGRAVLDRDPQLAVTARSGSLVPSMIVGGHDDLADETGRRGQPDGGAGHRRTGRDPGAALDHRDRGDRQAEPDRVDAAGEQVGGHLHPGPALGDLLIDDGRQRLAGPGHRHRQTGLAVAPVTVDDLDRAARPAVPRGTSGRTDTVTDEPSWVAAIPLGPAPTA